MMPNISADSDQARRDAVLAWLSGFEAWLADGDTGPVARHFAADCFWRDLVAFTWDIQTLEGRSAVAAMVAARAPGLAPVRFQLDGEPKAGADGVVEAWIRFETAAMRGRGHVRLRDGLCWTLLTAGRELKGFEEREGRTRERGAPEPGRDPRPTWLERREATARRLGYEDQPYALIVGGGQGGLGLGARLKRLGVPTLIVDAHDKPGDNWRKRYKSLCLHDPVWYDHMPYLPFPAHWPVFTPKDKLGDWLEMYARVMELDCWNRTRCLGAAYDQAAGEWTVRVDRDGEEVVLRPKQLVLATGMAGLPQMPVFEGMDSFEGEQRHSSEHPGGGGFRGRRVAVVGSNNSAHDICADLHEHGAFPIMVQRSSTLVVRTDTMLRLGWGALYSEEAVEGGIDVDAADLLAASMPFKLQAGIQRPTWEQIAREDAPFYDRLRDAGFALDFGEDGSGLSQKYLRRGSGYYIDVGASEMIIDGRIGLVQGQVERIVPEGVRMTDGRTVEADAIIYATGYGSMSGWAGLLISPGVAEAVGPCWGLGSGTARDPGPWQGELRNMWKPTAQPGLWFHGGNLAQSRHYSRYLALQLKARFEGMGVEPYADRAPAACLLDEMA